MTATIIPYDRLISMRLRKILVVYTDRTCLLCSHEFRSAGTHHRVCQHCRDRAAGKDWGSKL